MKVVAVAFLAALVSCNAQAEGSVIAARLHLAGALSGGLYAAPSVEIVIPPGGLGLGARLESLIGFGLGDVYLAPCLLLRIGRVDLGAGISFMVVPPSGSYVPYDQPSPVFLVEVTTKPLLDFGGAGTVRFDFGLTFFVTTVRSSQPSLLSGLADAFNVIGAAAKLELGLSYVLGAL